MIKDLIKQSNGDILGFFYFLILIIYLILKDDKQLIEYILLMGGIIGLIVDFTISIRVLSTAKNQSKKI